VKVLVGERRLELVGRHVGQALPVARLLFRHSQIGQLWRTAAIRAGVFSRPAALWPFPSP
jgi:hypothetical protein